jgi:hypothetical protein
MGEKSTAVQINVRDVEIQRRNSRFKFARLTILSFMFVAVRGPLFRIENLTELGWERVYAWKTVNNLVKAGVLEKYDRKSYGMTKETRKLFRTAFGGGITDPEFAYSVMYVDTWSKKKLDYFKMKLSSIWEERLERAKQDRVGISLNGNEEVSTIASLIKEKMDEASFLTSKLEKKKTDDILPASSTVA